MARVFNRKSIKVGEEKTTEDEQLIWREDYGVSKKCVLYPKIPSKLRGKTLPKYTMEEVAKIIRRMIAGLFWMSVCMI